MNSEILREHFSGMFLNFLEALANRDYKLVEKVTEKRMYQKLMENKDSLEKFKLEFDVNKIEGDESYIVEQLFVKGVHHDRDMND